MKSIFLFDPISIGHHLTYATNFVYWALAREFKVYFAGFGIENTFFHQKFANDPNVHFFYIDPHRDFGLASDNQSPSYADLFFSDCPIEQYRYVLKMQRRLNPDITVFLYGEHMEKAWQHMLEQKASFRLPTYLVHLFSTTPFYQVITPTRSIYADYEKFYQLFSKVFVLDEYQVALRTDLPNLTFLPDPYRDLFYDPDTSNCKLSPWELEVISNINRYLSESQKPLLLIIGWLSERKNVHWLLDRALDHMELDILVVGKRTNSAKDGQIDNVLATLKDTNRLCCYPDFVSPYVFDEIMKHKRIKWLALPYDNHFGSSAIQLLAAANDIPVLVPDIGLMGLRTVRHSLGLTYRHGDKDNFKTQFKHFVQSSSTMGKSVHRFAANFNSTRFCCALDHAFDISESDESPLIAEARTFVEEIEKGESLPKTGQHFLHGALIAAARGDYIQALEHINQALVVLPNHPGLYLRKILIQCGLSRYDKALNNLIKLRTLYPAYTELKTLEFPLAQLMERHHDEPCAKSAFRLQQSQQI